MVVLNYRPASQVTKKYRARYRAGAVKIEGKYRAQPQNITYVRKASGRKLRSNAPIIRRLK